MIIKRYKKNSENPEIPAWLLSGVTSISDIINRIIDSSDYDRNTVKEAMMEFQKILSEKLKEGNSVKSAFGTFDPHFEKINPVNWNKEFAVEFIPTKEMLMKIEQRKLKKLNNKSLN